jgi:3-oxoacyl-[acyl-carrier-protein] synthase II
VNATISGGQLTGLLALRYAATSIRQGYAKALVAGAVEEFCPQLAWGLYHAGVLEDDGAAAGEGCALFVLEDAGTASAAGRAPLAELLACEVGVYGDPAGGPEQVEGLATCIRRALDRAGIAPDQVWAASTGLSARTKRDRVEATGIRRALGHLPERCVAVKRLIGECYSASGAMQLAGLLSLFRNVAGAGGRIGLVTSIGGDGGVGCAVLKEGPHATGDHRG